MLLENCKTCDKHSYCGNGFVICSFFNMEEQRITRTGANNAVYIISCPREDEVMADRRHDFPPRWGQKPALSRK
jgi:hypothetical protein